MTKAIKVRRGKVLKTVAYLQHELGISDDEWIALDIETKAELVMDGTVELFRLSHA